MGRKLKIDAEAIKIKLAKMALQVESGELDHKTANTMAGIFSKCLSAIQVETKEKDQELARRMVAQQEIIIEALQTGKRPPVVDLRGGYLECNDEQEDK